MGDFTTGTMGDNQWAADDLVGIKAASSPGAGIYDFSGTVPNHVYAEDGVSVTKDEIGLMTKAWWDGSSAGWSSDADYGDLAKTGHKLKVASAGIEGAILMGRNAFGDGDCQHIITARQGKKGCVVAHADFTSVCGFFDEEANFPAGPVSQKILSIAEGYK